MDRFEIPSAARIASADLQVSDLARALSFYQDRLGFRPIERNAGSVWLSSSGKLPYFIRLVEKAGARAKPSHTTGLFHLAIRLPGRAALANLLIHLIENRTGIQGASDHRVSEAIYLADPDGNGLELYIDLPRDRWLRSGDQIAMTTGPLDLDDLIAQADRSEASWDGIDPGTDIGHIHLQVNDLGRAEDFYHSQLGFNVTQRSYPGALFLAAGDYHHHIGTNVWSSRRALPPPADAVGLLSFSIRIPGGGSREAYIQRLPPATYAQDIQEETKSEDSLWVRDPSANLVELIFDSSNSD